MTALRDEVEHAAKSRDYDAVEQFWNLLVRAADPRKEKEEFGRVNALVATLSGDTIKAWLSKKEVDDLLSLQPPLETMLASHHERLQPDDVACEMGTIRQHRASDPFAACAALLSILKRIRNKRVHGFKYPGSQRDSEILLAARVLLESVCRAIIL